MKKFTESLLELFFKRANFNFEKILELFEKASSLFFVWGEVPFCVQFFKLRRNQSQEWLLGSAICVDGCSYLFVILIAVLLLGRISIVLIISCALSL